MSVTVRTQTELDTALAAGEPTIYIQSYPGIPLHYTARCAALAAWKDANRAAAARIDERREGAA